MKTIGIIGSLGTVGSDLSTYLSKDYKIRGITRDNYDTHRGFSFDILINANGNSKRYLANKHPQEDFKYSTLSVVNSLFDFKCKLYIYISSSDVYEDHSSINTTHEYTKINPSNLSAYGLHKYLSEIIIQKYSKSFLILRSSMILGRNMQKGPIFDILNNLPGL